MLTPLNDYIVLKLVEAEKTDSGIILPESSDPMFAKGKVVSIGPGKPNEEGYRTEPLTGFPGCTDVQTVLFAKYAATKIEHEGETFYFIKEADILAKI
jgi:chaperonin GroES